MLTSGRCQVNVVPMKLCRICNVSKPEQDFNLCARNHSGRQSKCRACAKVDTKKRNDVGNSKRRALVDQCGSMCMQCGFNTYPDVLHFHHTQKKNFALDACNIRSMKMDDLLREVENTKLLCPTCHAVLHFQYRHKH